MSAEFVKQEGSHGLFRQGDKMARIPLAAAYSAYLCSPEGHVAIAETSMPDEWAVIAAHADLGLADALHVAVLPNGTQPRQLPHWFSHGPITQKLPANPVWLTSSGEKSEEETKTEAVLREAEVEAQINQRTQQLHKDSFEAETTNASHTLDGYIRCRVKRALHVINCANLRDTLVRAEVARKKMQAVLHKHMHLMPPDSEACTQSPQFDVYTPNPSDYHFVAEDGFAGDTNGDR